jgi:hypothetical protein
MKSWREYLLRALLAACVFSGTVASSTPVFGCCGLGPAKDECRCRQLNDHREITCYVSQFNTNKAATAPQLTAYPRSGTFVEGAQVTLSCVLSYASSPSRSCLLPVVWEHNGTAIDSTASRLNQNDQDLEESAVYISTLTISQFSESDQGDYVCRVGEKSSLSAIASPPANLQLPKFLGWIDRTYPPHTHANTVSLSVGKGGSVLLECSPNTTESVEEGWTPQLDPDIKNTFPLPSGSVLVTDVQEDVNVSCVWPLRQAVSRLFHITVSHGEGESGCESCA